MPPHMMSPIGGMGTELLYSFIIVAISLIIYFSTREIESLSSHKGIKYFRKSFLFFALAFFFKVFIQFLLRAFSVGKASEFAPSSLGFISFILFVFFSTLAAIYLMYSLIWKKIAIKKEYPLIITSLFITLIIIISRNPLIYLAINLLILVFTIIIFYKKFKVKKSSFYPIYFLLIGFLLLNLIDILIPNFLQVYQLLIYFLSSGVFLAVLYKVLRQLGA